MVYICGERETLIELKTKEGYTGSFISYKEQFCLRNPHLRLSGDTLPSYMPVIPVTALECDEHEAKCIAREITGYTKEERLKLWYLQESHHDIPTLLALQDTMQEGQRYAKEFRSWFDNPMISTPWISTAPALTNASLVDLFGDSNTFGSSLVRNSQRYRNLDQLYDFMYKRDALNTEIALLRRQPGSSTRIGKLEKEIKTLTGKIKQLLPKRLDSKMQQYLGKRFTPDQIRKMRMNAYSAKLANKGGRFTTLNLDVLNRSGLQRLKYLITGMKKVGEHAGKISFVLNVGFVAYDTYEAYQTGGNVGKTLFSGIAGIGSAAAFGSLISTSSLGALTIGALAGDAAIGGALLVSSPIIGTFVAIVVGVAVVGLVAYGASKLAGNTYDFVEGLWESETSQRLRESISTQFHSTVESVYSTLKTEWERGTHWLKSFYAIESN